MTKILIIGLCSTNMGAMERQQGNMMILIPMIKMLKESIPDAEISTSLQLSENFCKNHGIKSLGDKVFWRVGPLGTLQSAIDLVRCGVWRLLRKALRLNIGILIRGKKLREFTNTDIILDFSGDLFSSKEVSWYRLVKHCADLLTARLLGKPAVVFAVTFGSFYPKPILRLIRFTLNRITLISTREQLSNEYLQSIGVNKALIQTTACPAFLFEPALQEDVKRVLELEQIDTSKRPLIGVTIAESNMPSGHFMAGSEASALTPFVKVVDYLVENLKANVLLIPHVYRTNSSGEFITGPDGKLLEQIYQMAYKGEQHGSLKLITGFYSPAEIKGLIGKCDLYISGRLHAAVAAWSQNVPTVVLAYSQKHYGFARMVNQEKYVCEENDVNDIISKVQETWTNREQIRKELEQRIPKVKELSLLNAKLVEHVVAHSD